MHQPLQSDREKERAGETGDYFLKFWQDGGSFLPLSLATGAMELRFATERFQQSLVTLQMAADVVKFVINT